MYFLYRIKSLKNQIQQALIKHPLYTKYSVGKKIDLILQWSFAIKPNVLYFAGKSQGAA